MSKLERFGYDNIKGIKFKENGAPPNPEPDKVVTTLEEALQGVVIEWNN